MDELSDYRKPRIEPEPFDGEGNGFQPLERWGDREYRTDRSRWASEGQPMTDWRA